MTQHNLSTEIKEKIEAVKEVSLRSICVEFAPSYGKFLHLESDLERLYNALSHNFAFTSLKICEEIERKLS